MPANQKGGWEYLILNYTRAYFVIAHSCRPKRNRKKLLLNLWVKDIFAIAFLAI